MNYNKQKLIKTQLAEIKYKAVKHVGALGAARGIGLTEANNPESDCEHESADWPNEAPCQFQHGRFRARFTNFFTPL